MRPNESSAHGGVRRLLFLEGDGRAEQRANLEAGRYRLHAFCIGRGGRLELVAGTGSGANPVRESWTQVTLDFSIPTGGEVPIAITGRTTGGGYLAVDDVWLERLGD